jgi:hypothetical protein
LACGDEYTKGRSEYDWIKWAVKYYRNTRFPDIPDLDKLHEMNRGVYSTPVTEPKSPLRVQESPGEQSAQYAFGQGGAVFKTAF